MADTPNPIKATSSMPYVWAGLIFILLGGLFILALLALRPNLDPLLLIGLVVGVASTMFTGVAAFLKSQETHATVNSQLTEWKKEFFAMARAEGFIAGTELEQARVAEQERVRLLATSVQPAATPAPTSGGSP